MTLDSTALTRILEDAAGEGRSALLEHEVYRFLAAAGCQVPRHLFLRRGEEPDPGALRALAGDGEELMLKVVSPEIVHKTDVGGVTRVAGDVGAVAAAVQRMETEVPRRFARALEERPADAPAAYRDLAGAALERAVHQDIRGALLVERVAVAGEGPGRELLAALRWNREFGPVLTLGVGGVDTELIGEVCRRGLAVVSAGATLLSAEAILDLFRATLAYRRLAGQTRGAAPLVADEAILALIRALQGVAALLGADGEGSGWTVTELEVNPFAPAEGALVALDGLLRFRRRRALPAPRPLAALGPLLQPHSAGIIGVSAKGSNMGRIILRNLLAGGFDPTRTYVVRPDTESIEGVRCVPEVSALPEKVDLFIVAVAADQVPGLMEELARHDRATGVILIPGGMSEKEGGAGIDARLRGTLARARDEGRDLVAVGGNCLGILSRPGRYHTLFIPRNKLPLPEGGRSNVAFISQSGAYMISRMSKLPWLSPRYAISTGNQVDLTVSDFLRHLIEDPEVRTIAAYVEGFQDGDGLLFAHAVAEAVGTGRDVIFYKAGRTTEGKTASSGHTAALAGDYDVCEALLRRAGAHVARTFDEFLDLLKLSSLMGDRVWRGRRLAALSNAGFEAVGIADNLRGSGFGLELAALAPATREQLARALAAERLDTLVDVRNPLDLTPMASDAAHEEAVRALLDDPGVDLVLCATVPLTPAMATLAAGVPEEQSIRHPGSLVGRLARLLPTVDKPLVASCDSGALFDPLVLALEAQGIPTFRSVDRAMRSIEVYLEGRLARVGPVGE